MPSHAATKVLVDVDDVSVAFGPVSVLDNVSFCIHESEFVGLIGPNGAGKTTLLRVLLGLVKPSEGKVTLERSQVGYVPQQGLRRDSQIPISVKEVVGLDIRSSHDFKELDVLKKVGMEHFISYRFDELSGGQQQRVLIAKALASAPRLLILDEPTTGIDEASQSEFYETLQDLKSQGITIIMVSHDVDTILSVVDRVICLNRRIVYDGSPKAFKASNHLPDFYASQHKQLHHAHTRSHA